MHKLLTCWILSTGEGPWLKVFAASGALLVRCEVLPGRKVHGIRPYDKVSRSDHDYLPVLVFGHQCYRVLLLLLKSQHLT